jgi:hypothetical protein
VEDLVVQMRVVEERLGGNAADVEAGTAESAALLDTGNLGKNTLGLEGEPRQKRGRGDWFAGVSWGRISIRIYTYLESLLAGLNGSDVSGDTSANDNQILLLCSRNS